MSANRGLGSIVWCPKVTAIVPAYNSAAFVLKTLDCLAAQTWTNLEILIGDDCSTDHTLEVVRGFSASRNNVRILERDHNLGWLNNTNDLMARASGELMFFAFHDDLVAPTYVEKLVNALRDRPQAVLAFSDLELVELDESRTINSFKQMDRLRNSLSRGLAMARRQENWYVPNRGVFRASAFRQIGGIHAHDKGEYAADWTWLLHLALLGDFVRVPEVLCVKYYKPGSLSKIWAGDLEQQEALKRAGVKEVLGSSLSWAHKLLIVAYMNQKGDWLPRRIKPIAKKLVRGLIKLLGSRRSKLRLF